MKKHPLYIDILIANGRNTRVTFSLKVF